MSAKNDRRVLGSALEEFFATHDIAASPDQMIRAARFDAGLAFVHFPPGFGGLGLGSSLQAECENAFQQAGSPDWSARNVIGLGMAAPTILKHGTPDQRRKHLRTLFTGEDIWCQLFSEPGAGSDLAAVATRARRRDDTWVVNGQKVWTSLGHIARYGLLLARTDPEVAKHRGLTYFLLDMHSPGVEVRPLRQLTGEAEFNEVYLNDVEIPDSDRLGDVGDGWRVAITTLSNERVSLGGRPLRRGEGPIAQAVRAYCSASQSGHGSAVARDLLTRLWIRAEAARLTNVRAASRVATPGPEGSIAKLQMAELNKAIYEFCVDVQGQTSLAVDDYEPTAPDFAAVHGGEVLTKAYLRSLANSIEGGTSEVQRNILGERVLGLPAEPRVDKDIPWNRIARA
ncbi:acyl-CoA dehydrogenase family protein [Mycolicibacterium sp. XJ879]